jgi:hypothetical protein
MMVYASNLRTQKAEAGGSQVPGQPGLTEKNKKKRKEGRKDSCLILCSYKLPFDTLVSPN